MMDVLDSVQLLNNRYPNTDCNHVLLNLVPSISLSLAEIEEGIRDILRRFASKLVKLRITECEVRFNRQSSDGIARPGRIMVYQLNQDI
jgi:Acetyl-CoA carboxylase, central region